MTARNSIRTNLLRQTGSEDTIVYDLPEASRIIKVHPETLRRYCREGRIESLNVSSSTTKPLYRITPEAIEKFLKTGGRK